MSKIPNSQIHKVEKWKFLCNFPRKDFFIISHEHKDGFFVVIWPIKTPGHIKYRPRIDPFFSKNQNFDPKHKIPKNQWEKLNRFHYYCQKTQWVFYRDLRLKPWITKSPIRGNHWVPPLGFRSLLASFKILIYIALKNLLWKIWTTLLRGPFKTCLHERDSRSLTHDLKAEKTFFSSCVHVATGQSISKANFLVLIWTKKPTKLFFEFCPSL